MYAKMLQMTSIWSSDKTVDLEYHPFQGLLLKQQLDCMMNPLQSMLVNRGIYYLKKSLLSNSLKNSRYFLINSCISTHYPDQPPTKGYTASNRNSLIDWNPQTGIPRLESPDWNPQTGISRLESPVWWTAASSAAVLIPTSSYKSVKV